MKTLPAITAEIVADISRKSPHEDFCEQRQATWHGCTCIHDELISTITAALFRVAEETKEAVMPKKVAVEESIDESNSGDVADQAFHQGQNACRSQMEQNFKSFISDNAPRV